MSNELSAWAEGQRALARALGISLEDWVHAIREAGHRKTGLTAAVIGAAMARGLGMGVLDQLDGPTLAGQAQTLIDPEPPKVENPVLREALRRADELPRGDGLRRLKKKEEIEAPKRGAGPKAASAKTPTPDAPGEPE